MGIIPAANPIPEVIYIQFHASAFPFFIISYSFFNLYNKVFSREI